MGKYEKPRMSDMVYTIEKTVPGERVTECILGMVDAARIVVN